MKERILAVDDSALILKELEFLPCPRLGNKLTNLLEYNMKNKKTAFSL